MKRRTFISLLGGAAAWPLAARAQQGERMRRIAVLMNNAEDDPEGEARAAAFRQGLHALGWTKGKNLRIDWYWTAGDVGRIRSDIGGLARHPPDIIVANGRVTLSEALQVIRSIPIVFVLVTDPVGQGFISSLARPGGNVTGFTFFEYAMFGKSLELLKKVAPAVTRVGFIFNPDMSAYYDQFLPDFEADARQYPIKLTVARVGTEAEIDAAVAKLAAAPGGGLMVPPDAYTLVHRDLIVRSTAQHRLPAIYSYRQLIKEGGLMSYGPETSDIFRRSASYVDRILKAANPAELPAQAPAKFECAINLKTATTLGLTVRPTVIALAQDVIFASGGTVVGALLQDPSNVPVVFTGVADPVGGGLVASLARPGGNATGFTAFEYGTSGKWLELLKEIAPSVKRVAVLRDPGIPQGTGQFGAIQSLGPSLGFEVTPVNVREASEIERDIVAFARGSNGGLIITGSGAAIVHRELIVTLAARYKLPATYFERFFVAGGGLISYGPDLLDAHRRVADYVDRILKGERPADLPVQAPTKYALVVNLKTAKALGLEIPPTVLARADEVIE